MDIKKSLKDVLVLLVICSVFAVALAYVNSITAPIIADRLNAAADEAYLAVMPGAKGFEDVDLSAYQLPATVKEVKRETSGMGHAIKLETKGYATGMIIIVGVDANGVVTGATCVTSNETWGLEKTLGDKMVGKDINTVVDVEAGATSLTVNGYRAAVKDALNAVIVLGGGEADDRTEAEIFEDNLEAAIGDENADFTLVHVVDNQGNIYTNEDLKVTSIHEATNGKGYVFVFGKDFVGVDTEGNVITETSDENKIIISDTLALINNAGYEEMDITAYKNHEDRNVKKLFRSITVMYNEATDVYFVQATATGYNTSVKIVIYITIGADGKIIDNFAVSHSESGNWGAAQFKDGVYNSNFVGKDNAEAGEVDIVTGVTKSTEAYKNAIVNALGAIDIIRTTEGGAN